jgi:uncharacterized 2Fe-2S/4Fe-4S cluster protein (DUF4445 family)
LSRRIRIRLVPLGETLTTTAGTSLQDVLFLHGVEFPCGGKGRCKGCRVRVVDGALPVTDEERQRLTGEERLSGWRLACRHSAESDLTLHVAQWESTILADESAFEFTPREGVGIAVDVGSTTLVAQLVDLQTGSVRGVTTALNHQAKYGADIMSRVGFAMTGDGLTVLRDVLREQIASMIGRLFEPSPEARDHLTDIVLVGNTVMHHLFCGFPTEPLSRNPFTSPNLAGWNVVADEIGWHFPHHPMIRFLPCVGGFVGSDVLAGVFATRLHASNALVGLIDLGTNGEIVLGNRERLVCCSTAAGPAFEGARISMGMRAATGAISRVGIRDHLFDIHTIGEQVTPRGICGSGLIDAVACGLDLHMVRQTGRIPIPPHRIDLTDTVHLTQTDIREVQLAKGAISAGVRILLKELGASMEDIQLLHLAGAFGNYVSIASARRIGLLSLPQDRIHAAGNTALLGAKIALFSDMQNLTDLAGRITHIGLSSHHDFQDVYVEEMTFPS